MRLSDSDRPRGRAGVLEEKLRECEGLTSRIAGQMDAVRQARGCDKADLVALHANVLALGRELDHLRECVSSPSGRSRLRREPGLRRELSRWLRDGARKVDWMSAGIEPGFDLPHGDGVDWWEVWLDSLELCDRMAGLRRELQPGHTPHPGS